jgi:hypothetical protein
MVALALFAATDARGQFEEAPAKRAERLFREGKAALEANHFAEACPKLAESQRLDPGMGTLLALALCDEGLGKTATALRELHEVIAASQKGRADRAALAEQHARRIEPLVPTVTVVVPPESRGSVAIRMDGEDVPAATWAAPMPTDPGDHVLEAIVPGSAPWKSALHFGPSEVKVVTVPSVAAANGPVAASPVAVSGSHMGTRHTVGWIVGGFAVVALGTGSIFGGLALSQRSSATALCPTSRCSSAAGVSDNNDAKTSAWVADFGLGLGLVAAGTAAYLLLTHDDAAQPKESSTEASGLSALRLAPTVGPGAAGFSVLGRW